jgi:hypothetical protein
VCIFSYWIYYVGPGCIVHLPFSATVGVCVDPCGGGQVGVGLNVHVAALLRMLTNRLTKIVDGRLVHSSEKAPNCSLVEPAGNDALQKPSVPSIAVWPLMVGGLHIVCGAPS